MIFRDILSPRSTGPVTQSLPCVSGILTVLGIVGMFVVGAGCSTESSRVSEATRQVDALADAIQREDYATARALMSENAGSRDYLMPGLSADLRAQLVSQLRSRRVLHDWGSSVEFNALVQTEDGPRDRAFYVRFSPGESGVEY